MHVPPLDIPVAPSDGLSGCNPNDIGVVAPALGYQAVGVLGQDAVLLVPLLATLPLPPEWCGDVKWWCYVPCAKYKWEEKKSDHKFIYFDVTSFLGNWNSK